MKPLKVSITHAVDTDVIQELSKHFAMVSHPSKSALVQDSLIKLCRHATAVIACQNDKINETFLKSCPFIKIIAGAFNGPGKIDVSACAKRGVWVTTLPEIDEIASKSPILTAANDIIQFLDGQYPMHTVNILAPYSS